MYRVRPKWQKWPFWRVLEFAKLANYRRVLEFDKFAGEWPLLNKNKNDFVPDKSVRVGGVTDDQDLDGFFGDLVDGAPLNLNSKQEIYLRLRHILGNERVQ